MILQLKRGYLNVAYFRDKFGVDIFEQWADTWSDYEEQGYLSVERESGLIVLAREGLLQVDSLLPAFFEPQFQNVRYT
jgi:oxygen-independent coproporphyrinogen-3 oxidase